MSQRSSYAPTETDEHIRRFAESILGIIEHYPDQWDTSDERWYRAFCHDLEVCLRKRRREDPGAIPLGDVWFRKVWRRVKAPWTFVQVWRILGSRSAAWGIFKYELGVADWSRKD